jgi:predicted dehydrogenase
MRAIAEQRNSDIVAIVEPEPDLARAAMDLAPDSANVCSFGELLDSGVDGVVIATPSALHSWQAIAALERGIAVFCQKPLGRNLEETTRVIAAARAADRLLSIDLSYRFIRGIRQIRELVRAGELGQIYEVDLVFHNAYGPDKSWFYEPKLSGGGCVIDLGIHLVDLALWILDFPAVLQVSSRLFHQGRRFFNRSREVEDYAIASLDLDGDVAVRLACSWKAHAGCDAIIDVAFYGTNGGARLHNLDGSFFDFATQHFQGTWRETLSEPPEEWGGEAAIDWLNRLRISNRFISESEHFAEVAAALDRIYEP